MKVKNILILSVVWMSLFLVPVFAQESAADIKKTEPALSEGGKENKTVVYYFHGNMRCWTCKTIEALTRQAVDDGFSENMKDGSLELKVINIDQAENSHFVNDYQLFTRSVVVSHVVANKETNWKRLDRVWDLVRDDGAFIDYVQEEIRDVMKGEG